MRPSATEAKPKGNENDGWTKIVYKKTKKQAKVQILPEVIVIFNKGNLPYAEILEKAKTDSDLKALGGNTRKIQRILRGNLLFEKVQLGKTQVKPHLGIMSQYGPKKMRSVYCPRISTK